MASLIRVLMVVAVCPGARALAQPGGLYFHRFSGSVDGTEWSTWGARPSDGRLEFSDLSADGRYGATFDGDSFAFDGGVAHGTLAEDGSQTIDWLFPDGTNFHSEVRRAPRTDGRFPVFFTQAVEGDGTLSGDRRAMVTRIDPATGDEIDSHERAVRVDVQGTTVRVTDGEAFYQGVWMGADQAGFRVVAPRPGPTRYRSFPGSATSETQNMIGELRLRDDGSMDVTVFLQTRAPLGEQAQTMVHYRIAAVPPAGTLAFALPIGLFGAARRR